jgi:hypothetical protein
MENISRALQERNQLKNDGGCNSSPSYPLDLLVEPKSDAVVLKKRDYDFTPPEDLEVMTLNNGLKMPALGLGTCMMLT